VLKVEVPVMAAIVLGEATATRADCVLNIYRVYADDWLAGVFVLLSRAAIVKVYEPPIVGVPLNIFELKLSPAGNAPDETLYVYGPVPPLTENVCEYRLFRMPVVRFPAVGVTVRVGEPTVMLAVAGEDTPPPFVAV